MLKQQILKFKYHKVFSISLNFIFILVMLVAILSHANYISNLNISITQSSNHKKSAINTIKPLNFSSDLSNFSNNIIKNEFTPNNTNNSSRSLTNINENTKENLYTDLIIKITAYLVAQSLNTSVNQDNNAILLSYKSNLIILGHGLLNNSGYFVGGVGVNTIHSLSLNYSKTIILACYSASAFKNDLTFVSYPGVITLQYAVHDLMRMFNLQSDILSLFADSLGRNITLDIEAPPAPSFEPFTPLVSWFRGMPIPLETSDYPDLIILEQGSAVGSAAYGWYHINSPELHPSMTINRIDNILTHPTWIIDTRFNSPARTVGNQQYIFIQMGDITTDPESPGGGQTFKNGISIVAVADGPLNNLGKHYWTIITAYGVGEDAKARHTPLEGRDLFLRGKLVNNPYGKIVYNNASDEQQQIIDSLYSNVPVDPVLRALMFINRAVSPQSVFYLVYTLLLEYLIATQQSVFNTILGFFLPALSAILPDTITFSTGEVTNQFTIAYFNFLDATYPDDLLVTEPSFSIYYNFIQSLPSLSNTDANVFALLAATPTNVPVIIASPIFLVLGIAASFAPDLIFNSLYNFISTIDSIISFFTTHSSLAFDIAVTIAVVGFIATIALIVFAIYDQEIVTRIISAVTGVLESALTIATLAVAPLTPLVVSTSSTMATSPSSMLQTTTMNQNTNITAHGLAMKAQFVSEFTTSTTGNVNASTTLNTNGNALLTYFNSSRFQQDGTINAQLLVQDQVSNTSSLYIYLDGSLGLLSGIAYPSELLRLCGGDITVFYTIAARIGFQVLGTVVQALTGWVFTFLQFYYQLTQNTTEVIDQVLVNVWHTLTTLVTQVFNTFVSIIDIVINVAQTLLSWVQSILNGGWQEVLSQATAVFTNINLGFIVVPLLTGYNFYLKAHRYVTSGQWVQTLVDVIGGLLVYSIYALYQWKPVFTTLVIDGVNYVVTYQGSTFGLCDFVFKFLIGQLTYTPATPPGDPNIVHYIPNGTRSVTVDPRNSLKQKDSDGDGISDYDEIYVYGTNPYNPDSDHDGISDYDEIFKYHTNPMSNDTDGDLLSDGAEINVYHTNPLSNDTDGDHLSDYMETQIYHTNATNPDTDGDGLTDGQEVLVYGTDPNNNDTDSDGLSDYAEIFTYHTNPTLSDSDMDGIGDYAEIFTYHTDPMNADTDADGIKDGAEIFVYHTDPLNNDTDGDGVLDGVEITPYNVTLANGTIISAVSNPLSNDTDHDGLSDYEERFVYHTAANIKDTDGDGLTDYQEVKIYHTNPLDIDTDHDGLTDYQEIFVYHTNPLDADTDHDGLTDYQEIFVYHTDPLNNDTDGDGVLDGVEVTPYLVILTNGTQFFSISNPLSNDTDHDGLTDYQERYIYHTASDRNDTDGDRFSDGVEVLLFMTNPLDPSNDPITNLEHAIAMLPDSVFASPLSRQDALFNMLNATRAIIASDDFSNAYNKLVNSFRPKLDPNAGARSWVVKDTGLLPYIDLLIEMIYASIGKSVINLPY